MTPYRALLLDPRWQRVRLERLQHAGWKCEACTAADKTLHVHHRHYVAGRMPWEYAADELTVLCEDCHASEHGRPARFARSGVTLRDRIEWLKGSRPEFHDPDTSVDVEAELRDCMARLERCSA